MNQISKTQLKQRPTRSTAKTEWNMRKGFEHKPRSLHPRKQRPCGSAERKGLVWQELVYTFCKSRVAHTVTSRLGGLGGRHLHSRHWHTVFIR